MRRAAAAVALLLLALVGAAPKEEASAAAPTQLWYRMTLYGWFDETVEGISQSGIISEHDYASWKLRSNTATIVSRSRNGLAIGANLKGSVDAYDRTFTADSTGFPS